MLDAVEIFFGCLLAGIVLSFCIASGIQGFRYRKRRNNAQAKIYPHIYLGGQCPKCRANKLYITINDFVRCDNCDRVYLPSDPRLHL